MDAGSFAPWSIDAVNLAEHADNPVHTVEGGRAAGYDGAVVAGTTIYAYLTHPVAEAWGLDWVRSGGAEVRFKAAVLADEPVRIEPMAVEAVESAPPDTSGEVVARVASRTCAVATFVRTAAPPSDPDGERLEPLVVELDDQWARYGQRVGDDLAFYGEQAIVHPVAWACLANRVFSTQLVDGPWVHTRSRITHLAVAPRGATALVEAHLLDRFTTRAGERALVDVRISADGDPVAALEHEAIVRLV